MLNQEFVPRNDIPKEEVRQVIYEYCADEHGIREQRLPIWNLFESIDFDLDRFFMEDKYKLIDANVITYNEDGSIDDVDIPRFNIIMGGLFPLVYPVSEYIYAELNGDIDLLDNHIDDDVADEIMKYLYFCRTEEDIWNLFSKGIGDVPTLYRWFMGITYYSILTKTSSNHLCHCEKNVAKAKRFLDYLLNEKTKSIEKVRNEAKGLYEKH